MAECVLVAVFFIDTCLVAVTLFDYAFSMLTPIKVQA